MLAILSGVSAVATVGEISAGSRAAFGPAQGPLTRGRERLCTPSLRC